MRLPKLLLFTLALNTQLFAQEIKTIGTLEHHLYTANTAQNIKLNPESKKRHINHLIKNDIKVALNEKKKVTFGVLLLNFDLGLMNAVGTHHSNLDTWVLTPETARTLYLRPMVGGHELIITGYDDDATAIDKQGHIHKGLFSLRNSSSNTVDDKRTVYMSYDYFKVLQRIHTMPADGGVDSIRA